MIDFHTHIIPGIDDGSKNINETVTMLKEAQKAGFNMIVLTPHYLEGYYESSKNNNLVYTNKLNMIAMQNNIHIRLFLGNESYLSEDLPNLVKQGKVSTINNSRYLLFELPMNSEPMDLNRMVYKMQEIGITPILAHPERYSYIQENPNIVYDLIKNGVLMQSNYGSVLGQYGKKAKVIFKKLLENNMIYFLGSDVHRVNSIYTKMPEAVNKIEEIIGKQKMQEITCINPQKVLMNQKINFITPVQIKLTLKDKWNMK